MPRITLAPLIKLSKEQWKVLFERMLAKEGKLTTKGAGAIMHRPFEPPVEQEVGALFRDMPMGAGEVTRQVERLPIGEARAKYMANPEQYVTPSMGAPDVNVMRTVPSGSPEELAGGLAYERIKQVPILPPASGRTSHVIREELKDQSLRRKLKDIGINPDEDIRPGVKLETVLAEHGIKPSQIEGPPPAAILASFGDTADNAWKSMGGGRSSGAKVWEMFRTSSRQKSHIQNARDYFISSFVRWKDDPNKFTKAYPREARVLNEMDKQGLFVVSEQKPAKLRGGGELPNVEGE